MSTDDRTGDPYARDSFAWRRMRGWQLWGVTLVCIGLIVGLLSYHVMS
jgi:hypothetical protein